MKQLTHLMISCFSEIIGLSFFFLLCCGQMDSRNIIAIYVFWLEPFLWFRHFVVDLTAFTADKNKPSATAFSQGGMVPSPRTGYSLTKISLERAILFGVVTLENGDEGVNQ